MITTDYSVIIVFIILNHNNICDIKAPCNFTHDTASCPGIA